MLMLLSWTETSITMNQNKPFLFMSLLSQQFHYNNVELTNIGSMEILIILFQSVHTGYLSIYLCIF
jgi:hypothetical protein